MRHDLRHQNWKRRYRRTNEKEEAEPLVENPIKNCDKEDEGNLEENAAKMISSRFDPNYTGFSSNGKTSTPQSTNGLSFLLSPD